jgi:hypothetical protein
MKGCVKIHSVEEAGVCDHSHTLFPHGREAVSGKGRHVVMSLGLSLAWVGPGWAWVWPGFGLGCALAVPGPVCTVFVADREQNRRIIHEGSFHIYIYIYMWYICTESCVVAADYVGGDGDG